MSILRPPLAVQSQPLAEHHAAPETVQSHRFGTVLTSQLDDLLIDLVDQHVLGDREGPFVGVPPALDELRF